MVHQDLCAKLMQSWDRQGYRNLEEYWQQVEDAMVILHLGAVDRLETTDLVSPRSCLPNETGVGGQVMKRAYKTLLGLQTHRGHRRPKIKSWTLTAVFGIVPSLNFALSAACVCAVQYRCEQRAFYDCSRTRCSRAHQKSSSRC